MAYTDIYKQVPVLNQNWLQELLAYLGTDLIKVPRNYRMQVLGVKQMLRTDDSGLVSSMLDFAVDSASDVDYSVETTNNNLTTLLDKWIQNVNISLLGDVPTGLQALSKQYFTERWKGSSFLLLRTKWESVDGYNLPTKLWFVHGEDIVPRKKPKDEVVILGNQRYDLRVTPKRKLPLVNTPEHKIFIQQPYEYWGTELTTPFVIRRGLFRNLALLSMLINKGGSVIGKALEYLLILKKGSEAMSKENRPDFTYSAGDLQKVKDLFGEVVKDRQYNTGIPTYTTNWDTELEHHIPNYDRVLKQELYVAIEKRLFAGLGLVNILEGGASRKETILNPKPFIGEVTAGVNDFSNLIKDIMIMIVAKNKNSHRKFFGDGRVLKIRHTPVKAFMSDEFKKILRSLYDRGSLSKRTLDELVGEVDYNFEVKRREDEFENKEDIIMFAPVIQNQEGVRSVEEDKIIELFGDPKDKKKIKEDVTDDKKGPESVNFDKSELEHCTFERNKDLPSGIKDLLSSKAQTVWKSIWNDLMLRDVDIDLAFNTVCNRIKKEFVFDNKKGKYIPKLKKEGE